MPQEPLDANYKPIDSSIYDPTGQQLVVPEAGPTTTSSDGIIYAPEDVQQVAAAVTTQVMQNAATGTSNGTDFNIAGMASVVLLITTADSYTGTVTFNASPDGTTFDVIRGNKQGTTTQATSVAVSGTSIWNFQVAGLKKFRASIAGDASNHVTVIGYATPVANFSPIGVTLSSAVLAAGTALIGSAQISDGTTSSQKLAVDSAGNASVNIGKIGGIATQMAGSDGVTAANVQEIATGLFNGTTVDQARGNLDNISLLASAARTTTQTVADQTNYNHRGIIVTLDVTNVAASPSITLEIDMKDPVSGKYIALLTGAAVTTAVTNVYTVYPGAPATSNVSANSPLPRTWRVKVTANNANSCTYSVGASLIV